MRSSKYGAVGVDAEDMAWKTWGARRGKAQDGGRQMVNKY